MARRKSREYIELGFQVYEGSRQGLKLGLRQQRTIGSSKFLWGLCSHVGQGLTLRFTIAAGGPPANIVNDRGRMMGPRGSATDGSLALVLDRSGLATTTDRVQVQAWKVGEVFVKKTECLAFSTNQVFRCVIRRTKGVYKCID
ncbi:hypothetical protein PIB30_033861 [Stylosanthes scabra]|uniref:Uncharacterized protein n=1 Tax=Stylosanthes scabra TaxID=79078 RepID=A0ABU6RD93_9FABA|nr:hypothetical protein [Stylosanthes scabra]